MDDDSESMRSYSASLNVGDSSSVASTPAPLTDSTSATGSLTEMNIPSLTQQTWKPFAAYEPLRRSDLLDHTLACLRANEAIRRLAYSSSLINLKSQNPSVGGQYIRKAEQMWNERVKMYIEKIKRLHQVSKNHMNQEKEKATQIDQKMKSSLSMAASSPRDTLAPALARTRGIIVPQHMAYRVRLSPWGVKTDRREQMAIQPLLSREYYGDGEEDDDKECESERIVVEDETTTSLTECISDGTDADMIFDQEFAFYGGEESMPELDALNQRPSSPKWHRYRLPGCKEDDDMFLKGSKAKRREASKFVMADLIQRRKTADGTERRRAEEQKRLMQERQVLVWKIKEREREAKEAKSQKDMKRQQKQKKSHFEGGQPAKVLNTYNLDLDVRESHYSLPTSEYYMDVGLRPEMKLKIIKDYIRSKRWDPKDREMSKMNDLIDHWTKATKLASEQESLPDLRAWKDENEKNLFAGLIEHIKQRKRFAKFDPFKVLHTAYLRLGPDTVKALEKMCRDAGRDPGIHHHTDEFNIFDKNIFKRSNSRVTLSDTSLTDKNKGKDKDQISHANRKHSKMIRPDGIVYIPRKSIDF